jgi:hypothetical protein
MVHWWVMQRSFDLGILQKCKAHFWERKVPEIEKVLMLWKENPPLNLLLDLREGSVSCAQESKNRLRGIPYPIHIFLSMGICSKLVIWHFHCSFILIKNFIIYKIIESKWNQQTITIRGKHMCILDFKKYNFPKIFYQTFFLKTLKQ